MKTYLKCADYYSKIGVMSDSCADWAARPLECMTQPFQCCAGSHVQNVLGYLSEMAPTTLTINNNCGLGNKQLGELAAIRTHQQTYTWQHEHPVEPNEAGWRLLGHVRCDSDKHWHGGDEVHNPKEAYHVRPTVLRY